MAQISPEDRARFKRTVRSYYIKHGRTLPWRKTHDPYHVLVSEVMLQQTQVDRVIPKYKAFIKRFPTFRALGKAPLRDVLTLWQGLGYNRRALSLKKCAEAVMQEYRGTLPHDRKSLENLPGIGPYTAGAIKAFAWNEPSSFIETNIRTAFIHHFFTGAQNVSDGDIMPLIEKTLDRNNPRQWYSALMDYGAHLKYMHPNPNRRSQHHTTQGSFEGSTRQVRGQIIKTLTVHRSVQESDMLRLIGKDTISTRTQLQKLIHEGMIKRHKTRYTLA